MKVILTGNTGTIGKEVLSQCLSNPSITSIVTLTRRDLPITDPKLKQIRHDDFTSYPPEVLSELKGADACIWSLGLAIPKTLEQGKLINQDYVLAAAKAFAANRDEKPFRFVYVSGKYVERDQNKTLWFLGENRKLRGRTELALLELQGDGNEIYIMRPGVVGAKQWSLKDAIVGAIAGIIGVDRLALATIDIAMKGTDEHVVEMDELIKKGERIATSS